jgi:hypothetical protein
MKIICPEYKAFYIGATVVALLNIQNLAKSLLSPLGIMAATLFAISYCLIMPRLGLLITASVAFGGGAIWVALSQGSQNLFMGIIFFFFYACGVSVGGGLIIYGIARLYKRLRKKIG